MSQTEVARRYSVSPNAMSDTREIFIPLEYLKPRQYENACRYKNLRRIQDEDTKDIHHESWNQKYIDESSDDQYYTVTIAEENRLDIIALKYYNTPRFWWVIAMANYIIDPFDVAVGTSLRIPPIISLYNKGGILSDD